MGRDATKAAGNPWYQARKKAAEYDDRLCSRESAAEQLGMSVSSLADAELGNTKFMPVDKAVLMADRYSGGIRPALLLNSDLLVSLDDEVEDDCCGECDCCGGKGLPSLDGISTATLLEEIQRRAMRAGSVFMGEDGTDE